MLTDHRMRTFLAFTFLVAGCTGDLVELGPKTGGSTSGADMAQAAAAGGGGTGGGGGDMSGGSTGGATNFASIQADLDAKTCTSCHTAATPTLNGGFVVVAHATSAADLMTGYTAVMSEINTTTPAMSPLLLNPINSPTLTTPHTGGMVFTAGTANPTYQKWLAWITAGAPQQ